MDYEKELYEQVVSINSNVVIRKYRDYLFEIYSEYINCKENYFGILESDIDNWIDSALHSEVGFWEKLIFQNYDDSRIKKREFVYKQYSGLDINLSDIILDIGSGPLPMYGNLVNGEVFQYIPLDPLAFHYKKILNKHSIKLPVEPEFVIFETLTSFYKENTIDYIIVNNAMDHCIDIVRAVIECIRILKKGGFLLLSHNELECLYAMFDGLHQWGFMVENNELLIIGKSKNKVNISKLISDFCDIEINIEKSKYKRNQINVKIRKITDVPVEVLEKYDDLLINGMIIKKLFERLI